MIKKKVAKQRNWLYNKSAIDDSTITSISSFKPLKAESIVTTDAFSCFATAASNKSAAPRPPCLLPIAIVDLCNSSVS
jgi:hypothetical protein